MTQLKSLENLVHVELLASLEDFKDQAASALASEYGVAFEEIPLLRKKLYDLGDHPGIEALVREGEMARGEAAKIFAAEAMLRFERAFRKADFKLVLDGRIAGVYGSVAFLTREAAQLFTSFAMHYANLAEQYTT